MSEQTTFDPDPKAEISSKATPETVTRTSSEMLGFSPQLEAEEHCGSPHLWGDKELLYVAIGAAGKAACNPGVSKYVHPQVTPRIARSTGRLPSSKRAPIPTAMAPSTPKYGTSSSGLYRPAS